jgi:hypothetical protein
VTCFSCGEVGHIAPRCTKSNPSTSTKQKERRVDLCTIKPILGRLTQSGEQYLYCFDSGAEYSLIKKKALQMHFLKGVYVS